MNNLRVECQRGEAALFLLAEEWQSLHRQVQASPFLSWEWAASWQQWLAHNETPLLICVREEARLVGLLALSEESVRLVGLKLKRLSFLGEHFGGADYLDILSPPERAAEVAAAILEFLGQQVRFDAVEWLGLDEASTTLQRLEQLLPSTMQCFIEPLYDCPQVDLTAGWEQVLQSCQRADNFKRRWRQLKGRDGFAFRSINDPAEIPAAFERFLQLHEARWANAGGSELTGHERLQLFQRELVQRLAPTGMLRFDELWVEGECRASIYGFEQGQRYYFYNSGYDVTWRQASVGLVLLGLSIQAAAARGNHAYDFMRGNENYKFDWADTIRVTVRLRLSPHAMRSKFFITITQTRDLVRRGLIELLPSQLLFPLQQFWRAWKRRRVLQNKSLRLSAP